MMVNSFNLRAFSSCIFVAVKLRLCLIFASALDLYFLNVSIVVFSEIISDSKALSFDTLVVFWFSVVWVIKAICFFS